jgi:membrane-associated phospholipid phosphatase
VNSFDASILGAVNRAVGRWPAFDEFVRLLADVPIVKGCVFVAVIWALWWSASADATQRRLRREVIVATMVAALVAELLARALALTMPFRLRPIHDPDIPFRLVKRFVRGELEGWSAFPSDHAVLFFAVATGLCFASRRAGGALLVYAALGICLPRLYLGMHHPTDLIGGAVLGMACGALLLRPALRRAIATPFMKWEAASAPAFYAFAWYFSYELATIFADVRWVLKVALNLTKG